MQNLRILTNCTYHSSIRNIGKEEEKEEEAEEECKNARIF